MKLMHSHLLSLLILVLASTAAIHAQDEREPGWYDTAELSLISTGGNSKSTTFGFKNVLERLWETSSFTATLGGLKAESDSIDRFAVGSASNFEVREDSTTNLTAENYFLRLRYDRAISERLYWFTGIDWEQNEFAGFDSRTTAIAGLGTKWWEADKGHFYADYGLTYTEQDDLVPNPLISDSFAGLRLGWDFLYNINESTVYKNILIVDQNLDESDDLRADMLNSLSVSMTDRLALQVSFQLLYDNLPALQTLPLFDATGAPSGIDVFGELDDLDTVLTAALVLRFP